MVNLDAVCGAGASALTLEQLAQRCHPLAAMWSSSSSQVTLALLAAVAVGFAVGYRRVRRGEGAWVAIGNGLEGAAYGALGSWFGASAGATAALLVAPRTLGLLLLVFAALALVVFILALVKGDGGGVKALGALAHLTLAGLLVAPAISAFAVPPQGPVGDAYRTYVDATARTFALTGLGGAAIVALFRGYHWAVGWALVPLNASWGALGNLLGLMNHFACLLYYRDHGKPVETRSAFVRCDAGFHLKSLYDFTEGDAMSGNRVVSHEAIHVAQHFLLGPIYPLAHAAWVMLMFPAGVVAGLFKRTIGQAITDLTYFNNPFEVLAYAGGGTRDDGEPLQPLVFNDVAAWIVSVAWIAGAIAVAYLLVVARLHRILP